MRLFQLIDNTPQVLRREIIEEYCVDFITRYEAKTFGFVPVRYLYVHMCVLTDVAR